MALWEQKGLNRQQSKPSNINQAIKTILQHDHEDTGSDGSNGVSTGLPAANVNRLGDSADGDTRGGSTAAGARAGGGSTRGSSKTTRDGTSTGGASSTHLGSAGAASGGGLLGRGSTVEATSGGTGLGLVLLVVLVHSPGETLLGGAHRISAVDTGGGVGVDTIHDAVLATEVGEGVGDQLGGDVVDGDTLQGVVHALAKVGVGRGGELGGGAPVGADGGAAAADGG